MAIEAPADNTTDHQETNIIKVFDFNSPNIDIFDLRTTLCDIASELYMKWFRFLSRDHSLLQKEKEKVQLELETAQGTTNSLSKFEAENEKLRKI